MNNISDIAQSMNKILKSIFVDYEVEYSPAIWFSTKPCEKTLFMIKGMQRPQHRPILIAYYGDEYAVIDEDEEKRRFYYSDPKMLDKLQQAILELL